MEVIGFILVTCVCLFLTFLYLVCGTQALTTYNIGGVKNKLSEKVLYLSIGYLVYCMWSWVFEMSPFSVVVQ
jgi:hypothetical protein